jgi:ATP-dependent RNA helicase DeaD
VYLHRIGRTGRAGRGGTAITLAEAREHRLLRAIEQFTKSKIEVAGVPTVADVRARQLDLTRAALREHLVAGDTDQFRVVIETLAQEFDIVDIAAAAVKMAHAAVAGDGDDKEIPSAAGAGREERGDRRYGRFEGSRDEGRASQSRGARGPGGGAAGRPERPRTNGPDGPSVRLFIGAGRAAGIRPGDLVGAITGEAGIESRSLGAIEIADRFSLIEVPDNLADDIIAALKKATIRGKAVMVRRERPTAG